MICNGTRPLSLHSWLLASYMYHFPCVPNTTTTQCKIRSSHWDQTKIIHPVWSPMPQQYINLETSQSIKARTSSFQSLKWQCKLYTIHWQFRLIFKCINTWMHNLKALTTWMQQVQSMRHIKAMHTSFNQDQWCKQLRQFLIDARLSFME